MVAKYLGQPSGLPEELQKEIEVRWGQIGVQAFAFIDLNSRFQLAQSWSKKLVEKQKSLHQHNAV